MAKRSRSRSPSGASAIESPTECGHGADTVMMSLDDSVFIDSGRHRVELDVQRTLCSHPELKFSSLVVRRTPNGVCLEGVLEIDGDGPDVCSLARTVQGVDEVINRLMVHRHKTVAKG